MFYFFYTLFGNFKSFFKVIFFSALAVIIYNLGCDVVQEVFNFLSSKLQGIDSSGIVSPVLQLSGFAAWLAIHLRLPDMITFAITIYLLKFTLRKIPFLKW